MTEPLKSPYVFFGGKSKVASIIWQRFGNVPNFVEPFLGSGAVLLARPHEPRTETVNDLNGLISNYWRAVKHNPDAVAEYAGWPANENDLHARHLWLVGQKESLQAKLEGDPDYYDAKIAGWWVWGMALWIGSGFCDGNGPWVSVDGKLVKREDDNAGRGIKRQLLDLSSSGRGIMAGRPGHISTYFAALSKRLARVRVACGDWSRVCGPSPTYHNGLTGVLLDPPYGHAATRDTVYTVDSHDVADDVRAWCIENGNNPLLRIALCGYDGEHEELAELGWDAYRWKAGGGYGSLGEGRGRDNASREVIWFSPHCLKETQMALL